MNPDVTVTGLDIDAARVALARATEERSPRVRIRVQDVATLDEDSNFDAAVAIDLMHHLPQQTHPSIAQALARAVKPGGALLIKDIARTPRWKHAVNRLHDRLVAGEATTGRDPAELAAVFDAAGFQIERAYRTGRAGPYPHFILRGRRRPPAA